MTTGKASTAAEVRSDIVAMLRRDLVGPLPADIAPGDADLQRECLMEPPSSWYLTGYLAPIGETNLTPDWDDPDAEEERTTETEALSEPPTAEAAGVAPDDQEPDTPSTRRRFNPASFGLTVLLPESVDTLGVRVSWGDYVPEPRPAVEAEKDPRRSEADVQAPAEADEDLNAQAGETSRAREKPVWRRIPREASVRLQVPSSGKGKPARIDDSTAPDRTGGRLELVCHARSMRLDDPDGAPAVVRVLTVFLVNRRAPAGDRQPADLAYAFQARIELDCPAGLVARRDLSGYETDDEDLRIADLHYRNEAEYAVGRSISAGWAMPDADGLVRRAWTEPLPTGEVERVAPNEAIRDVAFEMEALADLAGQGDGAALEAALAGLPARYAAWIEGQRRLLAGLAARRQETGERLIAGAGTAQARIAAGIALLARDGRARTAFRIMNLAVARALRRRGAGPSGDPAAEKAPKWRPFQLAYILLNLSGLADRTHADRELVDLLFFPTGGGKTEAYLGLAAFAIAWRRLSAQGVLGAGVTVIMRYTLRLLTLDQLSRAAGMVCALELMRTDPAFAEASGRKLLGDWPIEIGLWVGSDASPNILGGKGKTGDHTAVTRVRKYRKEGGRGKHGVKAPAPIKACPWCGTAFEPKSFACVPSESAPKAMTITCANPVCDFARDRPLPLVTVDEVIYRRLPAFIIATVDKFAGLPWLGPAGAFFGHVDRHDKDGFYGASEPQRGEALFNDHVLDPPDLIIQDELHLISGPLGTVAGLYETAIDRLSTRSGPGEHRVRPKIVASTATVRRARPQIKALFDRDETQIFPPPGIERTDSWFAVTEPADVTPARLYLGLAAQGRGPKLVFLRGLISMMAAAHAAFETAGGADAGAGAAGNPADPYMTAVCYFNALRELGGARRIVEDEVRDRLGRYGDDRRRLDPAGPVFRNRGIGDPVELTSRVTTDDVALAKSRLETPFDSGRGEAIDVTLATNMISVGLDVQRLGLMLVQGQPKTAAEYIQATSRVGRRTDKPGLVVTVLNLHKPRDRTHYESFSLFHRTFYRSVEATSVTPWSARALDRALAAVVVAIARHLRPEMTPEAAVRNLSELPGYREQVIAAITDRAPDAAIPGGRATLRRMVESLLDDWQAAVDELAPRLAYGNRREGQQLLHVPLDPVLPQLSPPNRRFVAAWSMRDVEANVILRPCDPYGRPLSGEDPT
ncbi:MAG: hypothetical protein GVY13_15235 [Alphaproteobacteria bacterium]|jgi:hypothetical protein|nr:hypothetical protein [Alphaproteobacteria bacterium]